MIIDIHTHVFPDSIAPVTVEKLKHEAHIEAFSSGMKDGLISSMKKAGIDRSVVLQVGTNPAKTGSINDFSASQICSEVTYFGAIHPLCEDIKSEIRHISQLGLKGIKLHPVYQGVDIDDKRNLEILYLAGKYDLTVITHAGLDIGFPGVEHVSPGMIKNAVSRVGNVRLILAHMGGWRQWEEARELLSGTGVGIDTSFSHGLLHGIDGRYADEEEAMMLNEEEFLKTIDAFGIDNVYFGTDSPWGDQSTEIRFIRSLPLSDTDREKILGLNAEKIL